MENKQLGRRQLLLHWTAKESPTIPRNKSPANNGFIRKYMCVVQEQAQKNHERLRTAFFDNVIYNVNIKPQLISS